MRLLVKAAQIQSNDTILEVGCGTGSLTEAIAENAAKVIAVELDRNLAAIAEKLLAKQKNVEIINTDILKTKNTISPAVINAISSARKKSSGRLLLVANLPYNAACPVILNLVTGPTIADAMYVTVQKEVADRMTAAAGSRHYGLLSIFLSACGDVKTIRTLKPAVFWPSPQVGSAMVSLVRSEEKAGRIKDMKIFHRIVTAFMQHRRKMLLPCTRFVAAKLTEIKNWPEIFESCSIDPRSRPETIAPDDYIALANLCIEKAKTIRA